ncbi:MAG: UDP-N-acetylglucosamine 1-carboxyvinyltransferase, partial [Clostridia bacterium]|nr:UDP-N-acetylglucosamine 1-carboxyvinyltransferase [Clostridia bacterium]
MSYLEIQGGKRLHGELTVHGAKNSVLPLLAAAYMCEGQTILHNCPLLSDVNVSVKILEHLGCKCEWQGNTVTITSSNSGVYEIPENLMREMRSSV